MSSAEASLFPAFTAADAQELRRLGVSAMQVAELQTALFFVRAQLTPPAANNETRQLLSDTRKLAAKLARKLRELGTPTSVAGQNSARQKAANLLAKGYWSLRATDEGPTIIGAMCPRLDALAQAAELAVQTVPRGRPARYQAANPKPVEIIEKALQSGWSNEQSIHAAWLAVGDEADLSVAAKEHVEAADRARSYPPALLPGISPNCAFRRIVGICYQTVGLNADPERAIKAYLAQERKRQKLLLEALRSGIDDVKSRRTARKKKPEVPS